VLAVNASIRKRENMIDEYKRKDLHEENTEKNMEVPLGRRTIFVSLIVLGIVIVAIAGGSYLLQPSGEGRQITIFTISNLSITTPPVDEHPGTLAPDFSLTDPNGTSSWLSEEKYEDKIVLMSIDIDPLRETEETLRDFAQEFPYATWIWAMDRANLGLAYQVTYLPKTVIIDQDGYIRFTHTGVVTPASIFIQEIDQLLS